MLILEIKASGGPCQVHQTLAHLETPQISGTQITEQQGLRLLLFKLIEHKIDRIGIVLFSAENSGLIAVVEQVGLRVHSVKSALLLRRRGGVASVLQLHEVLCVGSLGNLAGPELLRRLQRVRELLLGSEQVLLHG